jgi:hypothetical protein
MQAARTQAVGISLLVASLLLAAGLRVPLLERWSALVPWVLLWGLVGFAGCVVAAHRPALDGWSDLGSGESGGSSERQIRGQLRRAALLHPATLVPLGVAVVSVSYLLLLEPDRSRGTGAVAVMAMAPAVAATSFVWRYAFRYGDEYARLEQQLSEVQQRERARLEEQETRSLRLELERGFAESASAAGARAFEELEREYARLRPALESRREVDPLSIARIPALATETYRRGLSVLVDALELTEAMRGAGRDRLEQEIAELERETAPTLSDGRSAERVAIREATLVLHRERIALLDRLQLRVEQLLHQAGRCEASLHRTRIELAAIRTGGSETSVNGVVAALQGTIQQAKGVQEKLRRLGY